MSTATAAGPKDSPPVLKKTTVQCCDCEREHTAEIYEDDNSVLCKIACPQKEKTVVLSNDAALWKAVCEKSYFDPGLKTGISGSNRGIRLYRLEITNACNFHCPICYANAGNASGKTKNFFLDVKTAEEIAQFLRKEGAKETAFSGGEPTLHPELETIIAVFKKAGIRTAVLTNGIRIAQEKGYAQRLKKSGLRRAYIQFDTLNAAVHKKMRGNSFVEEKKQALLNCRKAKIKTSAIAVIIKDNLNETGALLEYMKTLVPWFGEIFFITAVREAGRFDLPWDSFVYKEEIIKSLIKTSGIKGISTNSFYPFPLYRPFGLNIHPGCNVILPVVFINGRTELLENYVNIKKFYRLLSREPYTKNTFIAGFKAILFFLVSLNIKKIPALLRILFCYLTKLGGAYINYVLIESFLTRDFQDLECLNNCGSYHAGPGGNICSSCIYNQDYKNSHPWTRYSQ